MESDSHLRFELLSPSLTSTNRQIFDPCPALVLDLTWQTWQWLYTVSHPTAVEQWWGILPVIFDLNARASLVS